MSVVVSVLVGMNNSRKEERVCGSFTWLSSRVREVGPFSWAWFQSVGAWTGSDPLVHREVFFLSPPNAWLWLCPPCPVLGDLFPLREYSGFWRKEHPSLPALATLFLKKWHAKLENICVIEKKAGGQRGQDHLVDVATRVAVPNTAYQGKSGRDQTGSLWW